MTQKGLRAALRRLLDEVHLALSLLVSPLVIVVYLMQISSHASSDDFVLQIVPVPAFNDLQDYSTGGEATVHLCEFFPALADILPFLPPSNFPPPLARLLTLLLQRSRTVFGILVKQAATRTPPEGSTIEAPSVPLSRVPGDWRTTGSCFGMPRLREIQVSQNEERRWCGEGGGTRYMSKVLRSVSFSCFFCCFFFCLLQDHY